MWLSIPMIHNLLILICAFIILARETKYKILILRVDEIMLALFLAALESNEDKQVFIKIYEQHLPLMERTATRILKEQSDIEDAVQNAFVQIIRHFDKIYKIPREELPFWIISIVKNEALSIIRKRQKTVSLENWDGYVIESENVLDYPPPAKYSVAVWLDKPDNLQYDRQHCALRTDRRLYAALL